MSELIKALEELQEKISIAIVATDDPKEKRKLKDDMRATNRVWDMIDPIATYPKREEIGIHPLHPAHPDNQY